MTNAKTIYTYTPDMSRPECPDCGLQVEQPAEIDPLIPWIGACLKHHRNIYQLDEDGEEIVFADDCPACDMCGEPWCPKHGEHYADCPCLGPHSEPEEDEQPMEKLRDGLKPATREDCMAVWEFYLENPQYMNMLPDMGACERRTIVAGLITPLCDKWFAVAQEHGYDSPYDWEFVPTFLKRLHMLNSPSNDDILVMVQDIAMGN